MKRGILLATLLPLLVPAQADVVTQAARAASGALRHQIAFRQWDVRCDHPDALRRYAYCYKNPDGVAIWEMPQHERDKWLPIAQDERHQLIQAYNRRRAQSREDGERFAEEYRMNQRMCDFWRQQNDGPRKEAKVGEYCR